MLGSAPAPAVWNANKPPKELAREAHTFDRPLTVSVQVVSSRDLGRVRLP